MSNLVLWIVPVKTAAAVSAFFVRFPANFLPTSQTVQSPKWTHVATTPARPILCPMVKWDVSDITIGKEELLFLTI